jgi:hypothetical protein
MFLSIREEKEQTSPHPYTPSPHQLNLWVVVPKKEIKLELPTQNTVHCNKSQLKDCALKI